MTLRLFPLLVLGWLALAPRLAAHIGNSAVVLDGPAGPYAVRVIIRPPPVVPGRADIVVRLLDADAGGVEVTVLPVSARLGLKGAPPADVAEPVAGEPALRHAELWFMTSGSYSVQVALRGSRGAGTIIVPVLSVATTRLPMSPALGVLLGALGLLLFVGGVSLVGAAVRESLLPAGAVITPALRRRGIWAGVAAAVILAGTLYAGRQWWNREDRDYRMNAIYQPRPLVATLGVQHGQTVLSLGVKLRAGEENDIVNLLPDHGKLMHLFMIREPGLDVLAHLHPVRTGRRQFGVPLPPLPPGRYRLYADVTYETGFAATLTTAVDLGSPAPAAPTAGALSRDPDDSWFIGTAATAAAAPVRLERTGPAAITAGRDLNLDFKLVDRAGRPVAIEPYMGMLGHAAIRRSDGSVFSHVHPIGTASMAAQMYFMGQAERQGGAVVPMDPAMHLAAATGATTVSFPYLFPQAGVYRVWVQVKAGGRVVTGVFDLDVAAP